MAVFSDRSLRLAPSGEPQDAENAGSAPIERAGPGNLDRRDKWIFCLRAARIAADQERA